MLALDLVLSKLHLLAWSEQARHTHRALEVSVSGSLARRNRCGSEIHTACAAREACARPRLSFGSLGRSGILDATSENLAQSGGKMHDGVESGSTLELHAHVHVRVKCVLHGCTFSHSLHLLLHSLHAQTAYESSTRDCSHALHVRGCALFPESAAFTSLVQAAATATSLDRRLLLSLLFQSTTHGRRSCCCCCCYCCPVSIILHHLRDAGCLRRRFAEMRLPTSSCHGKRACCRHVLISEFPSSAASPALSSCSSSRSSSSSSSFPPDQS
jgi:hypothetical protein